ncbi:prolipoprotein diacylglyceryl transferase family protein, partial [Sinorhizobium meliloti]
METIATRLAILPFPEIDPVIFTIGPLAVRWYGLAYVAGVLLGWLYARRIIQNASLWRNGTAPFNLAQLDDF